MSERGRSSGQTFPVEEAIEAQRALRKMAGMPPEMFPVQAFVGMISDEIQSLRERGHTDEEIAAAIRANSRIEITGAEIAEHYAPEEERHPGGEGH